MEEINGFVLGLRELYKEKRSNNVNEWPPVSGEKLIELQLVQAEKKEGFRAGLPQHGVAREERTPIIYGELFYIEEGKKPVKKLIVEGNAGIGKTTLCTMLAEGWAEGKILTQFDCVLLLPLREELVSSANSLLELLNFFHESKLVCSTVAEYIERKNGAKVLVIADGWDELKSVKQSNKSSFLYKLLFGQSFRSSSVLLTSRPSASVPLHSLTSVDRFVEIVGFNENQIKQYIACEYESFPEKASSLIKQLESNPLIQTVCSVPLDCAIVCHLWHTLDQELPSTLTELYALVVLNVISRETKKNAPVGLSLESFDDIGDKELEDTFWLICKFAYDNLQQDQIVFSEREVRDLLPDSVGKYLCFGLLQSAHYLRPTGHGLSFHFAHLTIQEFLAALHFSSLSNEEKLKVCEAHVRSDRFSMMWRFVFGLTCNKQRSIYCECRKVISLDDVVIDRVLSASLWNLLSMCHYALESRDENISLKIASEHYINGRFHHWVSNYLTIAHTPHDCLAVFHVLRHTFHYPEVCLNLGACRLGDEQLRELASILSNKRSKQLQVRKLYLYGNLISTKGITHLFEEASASFSDLKMLFLSFNNIDDIAPSLRISSCSTLRSLILSNNVLVSEYTNGILSLESVIQEGLLVNLKMLHLSHTLTDDADVNGALLNALLTAIASNCAQLNELDLSHNKLGIPGLCALREALPSLVKKVNEFQLDLSDTNLTNEVILVQWATSDEEFKFGNCKLSLILSNNSKLECDGVLTILNMLASDLCTLVKLYLENIDFNTTELLHIYPQAVSSLLRLSLNRNNFSGDQVLVLIHFLLACTSLEYLYTVNCSISTSEISTMVAHLNLSDRSIKSLKYWFLDMNAIDDDGAAILKESKQELFPGLVDIFLHGNPVNSEKRLQVMFYST